MTKTTQVSHNRLKEAQLDLCDLTIICRPNHPNGIASYGGSKLLVNGEVVNGVRDITFKLEPGKPPLVNITMYAKSIAIDIEELHPAHLEVNESEQEQA